MSITGTVITAENPSDLAITMLCYVGVNGCTEMSTAESVGAEHTTSGLQVTSDQATSAMPQTSSTGFNVTPNPQTISETSQSSGSPGKTDIHYSDVIMNPMASQITGVSIVCATVCSGEDQSSALPAFVRGTHRWTVNSPNKRPVTWKCFHLMTSPWWSPKFLL